MVTTLFFQRNAFILNGLLTSKPNSASGYRNEHFDHRSSSNPHPWGVFWVGTSLLFDFFIIPNIRANGQIGQTSLGHLLIKTHLGEAHGISAILSALAGIGLYWIDSQGFTSAWTRSAAGLGFGIGAIFGVFGFISGILGALPLRTLAETAAQILGSPTPEQMDKIRTAQKRLGVISRIDSVVLILALIFMATARYWRF